MKARVVENSKVPEFLSKFSPISISAITIWPFVFFRGKAVPVTLNHELIHIEQYNDLFVFGFFVIYLYDYI